MSFEKLKTDNAALLYRFTVGGFCVLLTWIGESALSKLEKVDDGIGDLNRDIAVLDGKLNASNATLKDLAKIVEDNHTANEKALDLLRDGQTQLWQELRNKVDKHN